MAFTVPTARRTRPTKDGSVQLRLLRTVRLYNRYLLFRTLHCIRQIQTTSRSLDPSEEPERLCASVVSVYADAYSTSFNEGDSSHHAISDSC